MRISRIVVVVLLMMLVFWAPCSFADTQKNAFAGVNLHVMGVPGPLSEPFVNLKSEWEGLTGAKIDYESGDVTTLMTKPLIDAASKAGNIDVFLVFTSWFDKFVPKGHLLNLDSYLSKSFDKNDFDPNMLKVGSYNGHLYVLPFQPNIRFPFYRKDMFKDAGVSLPIKDFNSLLAAYKKLTVIKNGQQVYAWAPQLGQELYAVVSILPFLYSTGADVIDAQYRATINSPKAIEAVERFMKCKPYAAPASVQWTAEAAFQAECSGLIAYQDGWADWTTRAKNVEANPNAENTDFALYSDFGGLVPVNTYWGISVNAYSKKKEAAVSFAEWIVDKDQQRRYVNYNAVPIRTSVLLNSDNAKKYPWFKSIVANYKISKGYTWIPEWSTIESLIGAKLPDIWLGKVTVKEGLDQLADEINRVMKEGGYQK